MNLQVRIARTLALAALLTGALAAHAQLGGDEPGSKPETPATARAPKPIGPVRISSGVMAGLLLNKVQPVYPSDARVEGTVVLHVIIGKDGHVTRAEAVTGPKILLTAAIDAVKQWTYRPYLLNGQPSDVDTTVILTVSRNGSR